MEKEPKNLSIVLTAWYLKHTLGAAKGSKGGAHTAGDACSWQSTNECTFELSWGETLNAFTKVQLETTDRGAGQVPLVVGTIPFKKTLFIQVFANPTRQLAIHSSDLVNGKLVPSTVTTAGYWKGICYYQYLGGGQWVKVMPPDSPGAPDRPASGADDSQDLGYANFSPPYSLTSTSPQPTVTALIHFFLSQVRECTYHCTKTMQIGEWQKQQADASFIQSTPFVDGKLQYDQGIVDLNSTDRVLEVQNFHGPQVLAVSWPNENNPTTLSPPRRKKAEFLLFFHSSYAQNIPAGFYIKSPYPFGDISVPHGADYVDHGLYSYLDYQDPFPMAYPLGLPFSMRKAGKTAITILPMNRQMKRGSTNAPELSYLNNGEQCQCLLEEIQCFMQRAAGFFFFDPSLATIGCGSFSAGYVPMTEFRSSTHNHPVVGPATQEIYVFDPIHDSGTQCIHIAQSFRSAGVSVRLYNNDSSSEHAAFVHQRTLPSTPFVVDAANGHATVGVIHDGDMRNTRSRMMGLDPPLTRKTDNWDWGIYHANFVTTFLVDALRKSKFS